MKKRKQAEEGVGRAGPSGPDSLSETGAGIPDEAIGPEQQTIPEQLDLAGGAAMDSMAAKLQAEADAHRRAHRPRPPET